MIKIIIVALIAFFTGSCLFANPVNHEIFTQTDTIPLIDSSVVRSVNEARVIALRSDLSVEKRKKLISAMLAFPFPLGFMGAHRVMLGCKPWVPVVYMATFGGCFGLLPMIDFCAILFTKDITQYENNPHVFMWLK
jgi:TM2 domain-containing membrane protein YozV